MTLTSIGSLYPSVTSDAGHAENFAQGTPYGNIKKVTFIYIKKSGGGDLQFDVSQEGETYAPVNVSTSNGSDLLASVDVDVMNPHIGIDVEITSSTAECIFVGCVFWREKGVLIWSSAVGGSNMALQENAYVAGEPSQVYKDLSTLLHTGCIIALQRAEDDIDLEGRYETAFDAMAAMGQTVIMLGEPAGAGVLYDVAIRNAIIEANAVSRQWPFFNLNKFASVEQQAELGWDSDSVHLDPEAHRFYAGQVSKAFDTINSLQVDTRALQTNPIADAPLIAALQGLSETRIVFGKHSLAEGPDVDATFFQGASNERGLQLSSGAAPALGDGVGLRMGNLCFGNTRFATNDLSIAVGAIGYRNIVLTDGMRGMFCFGGGTTTLKDKADITSRAFGVEFAKGSDLGESWHSGIRLFAHNGVSMVNAAWLPSVLPGATNPGSAGYNFSILWNKEKGSLTLTSGNNTQGISIRQSMVVPEFQASPLSGHWTHMTMWSETAVTAAGSKLECVQLFGQGFNMAPYPFGKQQGF
jgi:hypothetical protein